MYTQEDANQVFAMMVAAQGKDEAYTRLSELIDQSENVEARQLMSNAAAEIKQSRVANEQRGFALFPPRLEPKVLLTSRCFKG